MPPLHDHNRNRQNRDHITGITHPPTGDFSTEVQSREQKEDQEQRNGCETAEVSHEYHREQWQPQPD